jgi:tetrahydromethanopterin S-methyltransferase subunit F
MALNQRDYRNFIDGLLIGFVFGVIISSILFLVFT